MPLLLLSCDSRLTEIQPGIAALGGIGKFLLFVQIPNESML